MGGGWGEVRADDGQHEGLNRLATDGTKACLNEAARNSRSITVVTVVGTYTFAEIRFFPNISLRSSTLRQNA